MALPAILAGLGSVYTTVQSMIGEAWTRYFLLLAGLAINNFIGNISGIYALEGLLSFVISSVFGLKGFIFPIYYGISSLLLIVAFMPLILYIIPHMQEND